MIIKNKKRKKETRQTREKYNNMERMVDNMKAQNKIHISPRGKYINRKLMRVVALLMTLIMLFNSFDITVFAMENAEQYIDVMTIKEIYPLAEELLSQDVSVGADVGQIQFPQTLEVIVVQGQDEADITATSDPQKQTESYMASIPVTWELYLDKSSKEQFTSEAAGDVFTYYAVLPEGYVLSEGINVPQITVNIVETVLEEGPKPITEVNIVVDKPVIDAVPQKTYTDEQGRFNAELVWYTGTSKEDTGLSVAEIFEEGKTYTAEIKLLPNEGYTLEGIASETIMVSDNSGKTYSINYDQNTNIIAVDFGVLEYEQVEYEDSVLVAGITITVSAEPGVLPEGTALSVEQITEQTELITLSQAADKADGIAEKTTDETADAITGCFYAFDIRLIGEDGEEVLPDETKGTVSVTFTNPDPEKIDTADLSVYHVDEESGEAENLDAQIDETTKEIEAITDSFSPFILRASNTTVTLYTGGGTISDGSWRAVQDGKYQSDISSNTFPTPLMKDATLKFAGWYSDGDYSNYVETPTAGGTYYAKWNRTTSSATSSYMKYVYSSGYEAGIDAIGIMDGEEIKTTYSNDGYTLYYTLGTSNPTGYDDEVGGVTSGDPFINIPGTDLYVAQIATFEQPFVRFSYYIWNRGTSDINQFNLGVAADVQIYRDDYAAITVASEEGNYYVGMSDGSHELRLYYAGEAVTDADSLWTGRYGQRYSNIYTNNPVNQTNIDSAVALSYKNMTIPANSVKTCSFLMGCGEPGSLVITRRFGFDEDGNGIVDDDETQSVDEDDVIYAPAALQKDGYYFLAWNTASDGSGTTYMPGDVINLDTDVSLYAQFKAIENTAEVTIKLDGEGWEGQTVGLYQDGVEKYALTDKGAGLYYNDKVLNGTYDIYLNGRKSDKKITFAATSTATRKTATVTYKLLHITTNLEDTPSSKPGIVTLRTGSTVIYTPSGSDGIYTEYVLTSEPAYNIFVDGADTGYDIIASDYEKTIDFYSIRVSVNDDEPWTDANVVLRGADNKLVATLAPVETNGNTVIYEKILQNNTTAVYNVWIDGIDVHKTVMANAEGRSTSVTYYTVVVNIIGGLKNANITISNGEERYKFALDETATTTEQDVHKVKHILRNGNDSEQEKPYQISIAEVSDSNIYYIDSENKVLTLTYWRVDFYRCPVDEETEIIKTMYIPDGEKLPEFTSQSSRINGYTFDFWSEEPWNSESEGVNTEFNYNTAITRNYSLYANYSAPTVTIGQTVKTNEDGTVNGAGSHYRMANLTISGFEKSDNAIKYAFFTTVNTDKITILDTTGVTILNGETVVEAETESGSVSFTPVSDKVALTFEPMLSMEKAQDFLRNNVVITPTQGEEHVLVVEVADKSGEYKAANGVTAQATTAQGEELTGGNGGKTLYGNKMYYVTKNVTYNGYYTGYNGLSVSSGATVYIYIPSGVTLTANGASGSGTTPGGAGIYVPSGSKLVLLGEGTVVANGGSGCSGSQGGSGGDGSKHTSGTYDDHFKTGYGGTGGSGGGGGGAGIGTPGGVGGAGGSGGTNTYVDKDESCYGSGGSNGSYGYSASAMGTLYVAESVTVKATGGSGGNSGGGRGPAGSSSGSAIWGDPYRGVSGGGGGGGGGAGYPGASIGTGGGGGAGGGGGGSAGYIWGGYYMGGGGGGGGYGYRDGSGGYASTSAWLGNLGDSDRDASCTAATDGSIYYPGSGASGGVKGSSSGWTYGGGGSGGYGSSTTGGSCSTKSALDIDENTNQKCNYFITFDVLSETSESACYKTYYYGEVFEFGEGYKLEFPVYEDSNPNVVFLGWQIKTYAKSSVSGSAFTEPSSRRYMPGEIVTLHPTTYGDIGFVAVTETVGGIRDDDETNGTFSANDEEEIYYTYNVVVEVDGEVDLNRGNIKIGDDIVAPGADGTYTVVSTVQEERDITIGGRVVGSVTGSSDTEATVTIKYITLKVNITGKTPTSVVLRGDGAPVISDNGDATYTHEMLESEAPDGEYAIYVDGENVNRTVSYGTTTIVPYYTTTVNITANGIDLSEITAVELRDAQGNSLFMNEGAADGTYTYTKLLDDTEYTVYINGEETGHTTDFAEDHIIDAAFTRYTTTVRTYLDSELFDKGTVCMDDVQMIRLEEGVYELTTQNADVMALSVDGVDISMDITPGTDNVVNYYTIKYEMSGETDSNEEGSVPVDDTYYLSGTEVFVLNKGTLANGGKTFTGWTIGGEVYAPGETFEITDTTTAYAVWECTSFEEEAEGFDVSLSETEFTYSGQIQIPDVTVKRGVTELVEGVDYTLTYFNTNTDAGRYDANGGTANAVNAGTVTVTVTGIGDYAGTLAVSYTINPKTIMVDGLEAIDKIYDGTTQVEISSENAELIGVVEGDEVILTADSIGNTYSPNARADKPVQIGAAQITGSASSNYVLETIDELLVTIERRPLSESMFMVEDVEYDGTAKTPEVAATDNTVIDGVTVNLIDGSDFELTYANNTHAGNASITVNADIGYDNADGSLFYTSNYSGEVELSFDIAKAELEITAQSVESIYGDAIADISNAYTIEGTIFADDADDLVIMAVTSVKTGYAVGTYDDAVTISYNTDNTDYAITTIAADHVVKAAGDLSVTATGYTGIYDGENHGITVTPSGYMLDEDFTIYYSKDVELTSENYLASGSLNMPECKNAGTYKIYYYVVSDNYEGCAGYQTVSIGAAPLTVTATDKVITYGETLTDIDDSQLESVNGLKGINISGLVEPDIEAVITGNVSYTSNDYEQYDEIGTYSVTPVLSAESTDSVLKNYDITYIAGSLTVEPKQISFIWPEEKELSYSGNTLGVTATADGIADTDDVTVVYDTQNNCNFAVDVGEYTARVTGITGADAANYTFIEAGDDGSTAECGWSIKKATNEWTIDPSISGWIEDDTACEPFAAAMFGAVEFTYSSSNTEEASYATEKPDVAGTYFMKATVAETDNYSGLEAIVEFTIEAAPENSDDKDTVVYVTAESIESIIYGSDIPKFTCNVTDAEGNEINLSDIAEVAEGESEITVDYTTDYTTTSGVGEYMIIPSGLTAKEGYFIVYKSGNINVVQREVVIEWPDVNAFGYTGNSQTVTAIITNAVNGDEIYISEYDGNEATEVGSYTAKALTIGGTNSNNYKLPEEVTFSWSIDKADNEFIISPTILDWYYGETAAIPVATAKHGEVSFEYRLKDSETWFLYNPSIGNVPSVAGTYELVAKVAEGNGYNELISSPVEFTINKAQFVVNVNNKAGIFGEALPEFDYSYNVLKGIVSDDDIQELEITLNTTATAQSDVGVYAINAVYNQNQNILVTIVPGSYTISKSELTVNYTSEDTVTDNIVNAEYDGDVHGITVTAMTGDDEVEGAVVYYSDNPLNATNFGDGSTTQLTFKNAGEYTVYYYVVADNYEPVAGSAKVCIDKKEVTVTANNAEITYGDVAENAGVTYNGLVDGETSENLGLEVSYTYTEPSGDGMGAAYTVGSDAGEYVITPSGVRSANYEFLYEQGTLIVNKKALTEDMFTVDSVELIYDGTVKQPGIIGVDNGLLENTDYSVSYISNIDAGESAIARITAMNNGNYTGAVDKTFTIKPCEITIAANPASSEHNEEIAELTWEITGNIVEADIESLEIEAVTSVKKDYAIGTYQDAITINHKENSNYEITTTSADYTITEGELIVTVSAYEGVYDAMPHSISIDVKTGKYNTYANIYYSTENVVDATNYTNAETTCPEFTDAGEYVVYYYVTCENYEAISNSVNVTITKAPLTVTVPDSTITYGDVAEFDNISKDTFVYDGFVGEDTVATAISDNGSLGLTTDYVQFGNAGTYSIEAVGLDACNYDISYKLGTLTVEQKAITISWPETTEFTYDGNDVEIEAVLANIESGDEVTVVYASDSANKVLNIAAAAGTYTAKVTGLSGADATNYVFDDMADYVSCSWTIGKADNSWTLEPAISDWVENTTASIPVAAAKYGVVSFSYSTEESGEYSDVVPTAAGEYFLKATVEESANYLGIESVIPFEIKDSTTTDDKVVVYVTPVYSDILTYGDDAPEESAYGYTLTDVNGSVLKDEQDNDITIDIVATGTISYGTDYEPGSSVGDYTVIPSGLTAKDGYEIVYMPCTITVDKKEIELVWTTDEFTYDGELHNITASVDSNNLVTGDSIEVTGYQVDAENNITNSATDVGTYTATAISFTGKNMSNYIISSESASKTWSISKAENGSGAENTFTTPLSISGWTYGDVAGIPSAAAKFGEVTFKYSETSEAEDYLWSEYNPEEGKNPTQAGNYYLKAFVEGTDNYDAISSEAVEFTITPSKIVVIANDISGEKGEEIKELTYELTGNIAYDDDLGIVISTTATENSDPGSYPIMITHSAGNNYNVSITNGTYFIVSNAADINVTASGYSAVYDGEAHDITVAVTDSEGNPATGVTVYYSETSLNNNNYGTGSTECPTRTDAGITTIYYYVAVENGDPVMGSKDIVITPKEVTVTANSAQIVYGEEPINSGVFYDGFEGDDNADELGLTPTYTIDYEKYEDVGAYNITPYVEATNNYSFTPVNGTLTVNQKPVTFTWKRPSYVYDGTAKSVVAEVNGYVNNDYIYVEDTGYELYSGDSSLTTVGDYTTRVIALSGDKAGNYVIEETEETAYYSWVITEGINTFTKAPTIESWTYGEVASVPVSETAYGNNSDIIYMYSTSVNGNYSTEKPSDAGTYYMKAKMEATDDYSEVESEPVAFQIKQAEITVTADTVFAKPSEAMKDLTYTISGTVVSGDNIDVELTVEYSAEDMDASGYLKTGSYEIIVDAAESGGNYAITTVNGMYQVTELELNITASGITTEYDGEYHGINVSVTAANGSLAEDVTIYYSETLLQTDTDFINNASVYTSSPTRKTVGTTSVYYYIVDGSATNAADVIYGSCDITITKKMLTVTANDTEIMVGSEPSNNGVSYEGFIDGEDETYLSGSLTYTYTYDKSQSVGSYLITPSGLKSENYDFMYVSGNLTVYPEPAETDITGVAACNELVYNGEKQVGFVGEPTAGDGLVTEFIYTYMDSNDNVIGTGLESAPTDAGVYKVVISIPEDHRYYSGSLEIEFTIQKCPVVITVINQAMLQGAAFMATDVSVTGFIGDDGESDTVLSVEPEIVVYDSEDNRLTDVSAMTAGEYVLKAEGNCALTDELSENYSIDSSVNGILTVLPVDYDSDEEDATGSTVVLDPDNPDSGIVKTAVIKEDVAPDAELEANLTVEKAEALLDDTEEQLVKSGENALIYLLWDAADEKEYIEEKIAIADVAEQLEGQVGIFLDVSLYKVVGDNAPIKVTNVDETKVTIQLKLPTELINSDSKIIRTYYVVYEHEGVINEIEPDYSAENSSLTFDTNEFSLYSIVYKDVLVEDDAEEDDAEEDDAENDDAENDDAENDDAENDDAENDDAEEDDAENDDAENDDAKPEDPEIIDTESEDAEPEDVEPEDAESEDAESDDTESDNEGNTEITETENNNTPSAEIVDSIPEKNEEEFSEALAEIQDSVPGVQPGPYVKIPDGQNVVVDENGKATFTFAIPDDIKQDGRTYYLVTVDADGNIIVLENESIVDGMLTFTGDPNATYQIIYEDGSAYLADLIDENGYIIDKDGENVSVKTKHCFWHYIIFILTLLGVALMLIFRNKKRYQFIAAVVDSIVMIILAVVGWCIWDIVFIVIGIIMMMAIIIFTGYNHKDVEMEQ